MRVSVVIIVCAVLAALGCQADEFIPPPVDARLVDAPRPVADAAAADDAVPVDAGGDAGPVDAAAVDGALPDALAVDAIAPTYTHDVDIQPVWTANCTNASCHLFMMDAYDNIVNIPSGQVPSMRFIQPGSPEMSYIWRKLENTHLAAGGMGEAMPPGGPLKASTRTMIRVWIEEGAPR